MVLDSIIIYLANKDEKEAEKKREAEKKKRVEKEMTYFH